MWPVGLNELSPSVALHLGAAMGAVVLGPFALFRQRRDIWHRSLGYCWVLSMATLALGSFWIKAHIFPIVAGFGPIHLLSAAVLWYLWRAVGDARAGRVAAHSRAMRSLYWQALCLAGLFTIFPGRTLNRALFPDRPQDGLWVIGGVLSMVIGRFAYLRLRRHGRA